MSIFDLESGWKNSEVARLFVEASEQACGDDEPEALKATEIERHKDGSVEVELEPKTPAVPLEKIRAEFDSWQARQALVRLASQAAKNGNIKAAYLIERTLVGLDSD